MSAMDAPARAIPWPKDLRYARALPRLIAEAELTCVSARGYLAFHAGGSPGAQLMRANIHQVREQLIATERVSAEDIRGYLDPLQDGALLSSLPLLLSAWGRRPV